MRLLYDIETDGLLHEMTRVHCICAIDLDTKVQYAWWDAELDLPVPEIKCAGTVAEGIRVLNNAELRVGHNIVTFDEVALERFGLIPRLDAGILDTLVVCRTLWPDEHLKKLDFVNLANGKGRLLNKQLFGRQSLMAWGIRLGIEKGTFGQTLNAWERFTAEMLRYCAQDVRATAELYRLVSKQIAAKKTTLRTLAEENKFALHISRQMDNGFMLDRPRLDRLVQELAVRRAALSDELAKEVPPFVDVKRWVTPKKKIAKEKTVTTIFNPNSTAQVARHLIQRLGWRPTEYTPTGKPKLDDKIMSGIDLPGVQKIKEHTKVVTILGMVAEGESGWLRKVKPDGRLHGFVNHNGTITGRCSHSEPNVTQVAKVRKSKTGQVLKGYPGGYGWDCRECFIPRPGWKLVGADASGLELRMLAHYLYKFDGGAYAIVVSEGDPHQRHANALEADRDLAKTFIYAFLYGAGDHKLAKTLGCSAIQARVYRKKFLAGITGLAALISDIQSAAEQKKALRLPDGRVLHVRKKYAALNTLLQGLGALVMKYAVNRFHIAMAAAGYAEGRDYAQCHQAHDELQVECPEAIAEFTGQAIVHAIEQAGVALGLKCPLTGEYKVGNNWAETH